VLSVKQLSKLAGTSRQAVFMAVKRGLFAPDSPGFFDEKDPAVKHWLQSAQGRTGERVARQSTVTDKPVEHDGDVPEETNLDERKKLADIRLRDAQSRALDMKHMREKNILIPREMVVRKFAAFDVALKNSFLAIPRRVTAQVFALAQAGDEMAVERYLEKEVSAAIQRAKNEAIALQLVQEDPSK